ncbi:hypothetical protein GQ457_03G008900 [Hibiscus cannabinus]
MQQLPAGFQHVFESTGGLPPARATDHSIHLIPTSNPVNVRPYRYPHFQKDEIERQVRQMLDAQLIQKSHSPFSSPVLLVKKKDGTWRFCVDYRALNAITIKGYHQIRVRPEDVPKTAFRTHEGHYEFRVMPFGLTNAPSTFQSTMNDIFRPYLRKFILIFLDDILVFSPDWSTHLQHVQKVLEVLQEHGFVAKRSKCVFGQHSIEYLGHVVSREGLAVDPSKVAAIQAWPAPTNVKEVRAFLGLAGYYHRFIQGFATLAAPLSDMLRKAGTFEWTQPAQAAFEVLKQKLCATPVLGLPDFTKEFIIETDASRVGIGAVLTQGTRPLAYYSQKLSPRMQSASTYHREIRFIIVTDQQALRELTQQTIQTPEQQKWLSKLIGYDFEIRYRPGKLNAVADALSREVGASLMAFSRPLFGILDDIRLATENDSEMRELKKQLIAGHGYHSDYSLQEGLIVHRGRIMVPKEAALRAILLREFHSSMVGGHAGNTRTFNRLSANFYWQGMRKDVRTFVRDCQVCQRMKSESLAPAGLLQPLPIPQRVFEDISMDFITALPKSNGNEAVMVVVDRFTKYGHFFALPRHFDSQYIAKLLIQGLVKLHGIPRSIVSDRDRIFVSEVWTELARLQGTELCMSSAYHPQTDGQTEALNRCLEMYLRCIAGDDPSKWEGYLAWAEYWYNTAYHASAGMTPFKALYGRDPPTILTYMDGDSTNTQLDQDLKERDQLLRELKQNLSRAQNRMKMQVDKHRRELELKEGDWVFVRLQPYRQLSLRLRKQQKLSPRFFGPYRVLQRVGPVAYRLDLPASTRIHHVFHISQLKPCIGQPLQQITPLPLLDSSVDTITTNVSSNLEDKVPEFGGGDVTDEQEHDTNPGPGGVTTNEPTDQDPPADNSLRRGNRERRIPKVLTDFVLF